MGTVVTVHEIYTRRKGYRTGERRDWVKMKLPRPRAGWVVGIRSLKNGTYYAGSTYDDYEPAYLKVDSSVRCALVAFTPYQTARARPDRLPNNW